MNKIDYVVTSTTKYIEQMTKAQRKKYGQFFTSKETAVFMAELFDLQSASGIEEARKFVIESIKDLIEFASHNVGLKDYKTVLQEKLQENGDVKIEYKIFKETGPDHDKTFYAEVECEGKKLAEGKGRSKKAAEMQAAKKALEIL